MLPEISVTDLSEKLASDEQFILLDIREPDELNHARITDSRMQSMPMSRLAREGAKALLELAQAQTLPMFVLCHHGSRSMQVTAWLVQQGWTNVFNVHGGIDEYARKVDQSVGFY